MPYFKWTLKVVIYQVIIMHCLFYYYWRFTRSSDALLILNGLKLKKLLRNGSSEFLTNYQEYTY